MHRLYILHISNWSTVLIRQPDQYINTSIRSTLVCQYAAVRFTGPYGPDIHIYICNYIKFFREYKLYCTNFWYSLITCIMYMFLCSGVVKYMITTKGGSKSFNTNHSRRADFSSELTWKFLEKPRKHALHALAFLETLLLHFYFFLWFGIPKPITGLSGC